VTFHDKWRAIFHEICRDRFVPARYWLRDDRAAPLHCPNIVEKTPAKGRKWLAPFASRFFQPFPALLAVGVTLIRWPIEPQAARPRRAQTAACIPAGA
jgi:hypothetical protein